MQTIYKKTKALLYCIFFILSVLVVFVCFYTTRCQDKIWHIRRKWAKIQAKVIPFDIELVGEFNLEAKLIMMNHQSMLDIIALESIYPRNLAWIAKKELGELPIFKIAMKKPKLLCIDRKDPRALINLLKEAKERIEEDRVLSIFPEGTRSKTEKMLKFQGGAKILAQKLNLKVQPILIVDSAKILDSKDFTINGGTLKIICLDLIDTSDEKWLENTRKKMQELLEKERQICS